LDSPQVQMYLASPGPRVILTGPVVMGAAGGRDFSCEWQGQSEPSQPNLEAILEAGRESRG
jgi:hypothetical protein